MSEKKRNETEHAKYKCNDEYSKTEQNKQNIEQINEKDRQHPSLHCYSIHTSKDNQLNEWTRLFVK